MLVVVGDNEPSLAPVVYASGAFLVRNAEPERGQYSSLQVGLQEVLNRGRDAAMVTLVDRPPVNRTTIERLHDAFETAITCWKWAVIPEYGGRHGHPIVLAREMIEAFLKAPATATARDIEHQNQEHIDYLPVDDPLVTANINTPDEYVLCALRLRSNGLLKEFQLTVVRLSDKKPRGRSTKFQGRIRDYSKGERPHAGIREHGSAAKAETGGF